MTEWIPLLQALVWPVFLGIVLVAARSPVTQIIDAIRDRIREGAAVEFRAGAAGLSLGGEKMPRPPAEIERAAEAVKRPRKPGPPTADDDLLNTLYLIHLVSRPRRDGAGRDLHPITIKLDADSDELLDGVERVVYHLHPTFRPASREVRDRASQFELNLSAWGEFNLSADVYLKGAAEPLALRRYLNF